MEAISNFAELFQLNDGGRSLFGMLQEKMRTLKIRDSEDRQIFEQFCCKGKERNAVLSGEKGEQGKRRLSLFLF